MRAEEWGSLWKTEMKRVGKRRKSELMMDWSFPMKRGVGRER